MKPRRGWTVARSLRLRAARRKRLRRQSVACARLLPPAWVFPPPMALPLGFAAKDT